MPLKSGEVLINMTFIFNLKIVLEYSTCMALKCTLLSYTKPLKRRRRPIIISSKVMNHYLQIQEFTFIEKQSFQCLSFCKLKLERSY